jgi:hypothetical protein
MLHIVPIIGVPYSRDVPYVELRTRAEAACNAALLLTEHGLNLHVDVGVRDEAAGLAFATAMDSSTTTKKLTDNRLNHVRPAALILVDQILNEFGHNVAESATTIRNLVTNKLLLESENADPRVRLRALEMLGKISDVGLFAEKSEVTIRNKTSEDIRSRLRNKLGSLQLNDEIAEDAVIINDSDADVDRLFGLAT